MMFVAAASLFWAPADRGGDRAAALSMLERGIRLAESSPANADPLVASWGEAELHMLLAWFSLNVVPPQGSRAMRHAEAALALRPHWRYVRDILIPQIRQRGGAEGGRTMSSALTTLAYRVHRMPAMLAFYSEAFGVQFREVDTGGGIVSRFGELNGITLKFVPIRDAVDFEGFPVHQPGFEVSDVAAVLAAARKHGGSVQNEPVMRDGRLHAAVRDPDGNTIELYGTRQESR
jgi:predicted enzyme related to lactoylglutathione lyase